MRLVLALKAYVEILHEFARAAVTKYHGLGGFNHKHSLSHGSGVWKPTINMSAGLFPTQTPFLGLQVTIFSLCPHVVFPLRLYIPRGSCVCLNFLLEGHQSDGMRATLSASF